jgi:GNAT superfamily N-acetyltransferase
VVTSELRGRGIGRALLAKVAEEARRRGLRKLAVSPSVRDASALRTLHAAGFSTIATVTLALDLSSAPERTSAPHGESLDLYDLQFGV